MCRSLSSSEGYMMRPRREDMIIFEMRFWALHSQKRLNENRSIIPDLD
jgi:hypothetical protein